MEEREEKRSGSEGNLRCLGGYFGKQNVVAGEEASRHKAITAKKAPAKGKRSLLLWAAYASVIGPKRRQLYSDLAHFFFFLKTVRFFFWNFFGNQRAGTQRVTKMEENVKPCCPITFKKNKIK